MLHHKEEVPVLCPIFKTTPITPCIWISCPRSFLLQIVKHHSQEVGLQRRVFVDFFCNPERLRSQVRELTARVRALQVAWSTCSFSLSVYSILTSLKNRQAELFLESRVTSILLSEEYHESNGSFCCYWSSTLVKEQMLSITKGFINATSMKHGTEKWILSAVAYLQMPLAQAKTRKKAAAVCVIQKMGWKGLASRWIKLRGEENRRKFKAAAKTEGNLAFVCNKNLM